MYCPRCRDEYREGFTWCRDCDAALVDRLPPVPGKTNIEDRETEEGAGAPGAEQEHDDQPLVTVGQYFNPIEAQGHRMALEQAGLRAWVCDESIGAIYRVGVGTRLQVRAQDEVAAHAVLEMDSVPASSDSWPDLRDDVVGLLGQMGVRDGPDFDARWASFFRQAGAAAVFPFESFFAA